ESTAQATFTLTLSAASGQAVIVTYNTADGTATAPDDYTAVSGGTVTFAPGETVKTVNVLIVADASDEPDQTFFVNLMVGATVDAGGSDLQGQAAITDNDAAPTLTIDDVTVNEADGTADFTVTLTGLTGQVVTVVASTSNGSAVAPGDYTTTTTTLTF